MRLPPGPLALAASLAALFLYSACGGAPAPDVSPTASPIDTPGTPQATDTTIIDLATASPMTVIYAVGEGDLQSDQPALATGDFNNDGVDDLLVGARFADPDGRQDAGAAYVVFGSRSPPQSVDLAALQQDLTIIGALPGDNLGFSAVAADINGDGIADIVLGAFSAGTLENPSVRTGAVYVLFGSDNLPVNLDLAEAKPDITISGLTSRGFFGDSLASGDVNGDGMADLIIGATFDRRSASGGPSVRGGATYVFFGRQSWPAGMSAGDSDVAVYGAEELDELGDFVASGDINGDGFDDIISTAEAADGPDNDRPTSAEVHVVFGHPDIEGTFEITRGDQDLSIYGANASDTLGFSLATGDLDGDGVDDLVMGARLGNSPSDGLTRTGHVYVLYGRQDLPASVDLADTLDFVIAIHGQNQSDSLGTIEAIADLDGDGRNELIMGTGFGDAPSRPDAGVIYVASSPAETDPAGIVSVADTPLQAIIYGAAPSDLLGSSVTTGDLDGDGRPELIAVAMNADGPGGERPGVGSVYVIVLGQ